MKCQWHLCTKKIEETVHNKKFCSLACKNKFHVTLKRQELKKELVAYKGGKCEKCGYNKCMAALDFHHLDESKKEFGLGHGVVKSIERLKAEADKCILVCANCHREIHATVITNTYTSHQIT